MPGKMTCSQEDRVAEAAIDQVPVAKPDRGEDARESQEDVHRPHDDSGNKLTTIEKVGATIRE